jgi:hypothetical protein
MECSMTWTFRECGFGSLHQLKKLVAEVQAKGKGSTDEAVREEAVEVNSGWSHNQ